MTGEGSVKIDLGGGVKTVEVGDRRYVETSLSMDEVERAFLAATRWRLYTTGQKLLYYRQF